MIQIFLASDHAGFELKYKIAEYLRGKSGLYELIDLGTRDSVASVDYPDFASLVAERIKDSYSSMTRGILVCGSGQGMAMRANKYPHIRAALVWNQESTQLAREHNDANILCLGGRLIDHSLALSCVETFLTTPFAGGRHAGRVAKVSASVAE